MMLEHEAQAGAVKRFFCFSQHFFPEAAAPAICPAAISLSSTNSDVRARQ